MISDYQMRIFSSNFWFLKTKSLALLVRKSLCW